MKICFITHWARKKNLVIFYSKILLTFDCVNKKPFEIIKSKRMRFIRVSFFVCMLGLLITCHDSRKEHINSHCAEKSSEQSIYITSDYKETPNLISLNWIADTVFYLRLKHKMKRDVYKVDYTKNLVFLYDLDSIFAFEHTGHLKYRIPAFGCSVDILQDKHKIYVYSFKNNAIFEYDFCGQKVRTIRLKHNAIDGYGSNFLAINDTLFAIAKLNEGKNKYELLFFNANGNVVGRKNNPHPFSPQPTACVFRSVWERTLFRTPDGCRYYRAYGDTLFAIDSNMEITPIWVEEKLSKVPLGSRLEYRGGKLSAFLDSCRENHWHSVRYMENKRFVIAEYVPGRSPYDLPGYMIYDKKGKTLGRLEQSLTNGFASHKFHFGIMNDYDGGLGFTPLCQSGDYLIMVNAGFSQGSFENAPKTLYEKGRIINGEKYICRSDSFVNVNAQKRLKDFIRQFDEEQNTMLSIVKLKDP